MALLTLDTVCDFVPGILIGMCSELVGSIRCLSKKGAGLKKRPFMIFV